MSGYPIIEESVPVIHGLLTAEQVCQLLGGVSRRHLTTLTASGHLISVKIGSNRRWTQEDLTAFINKHRVVGADDVRVETPRPVMEHPFAFAATLAAQGEDERTEETEHEELDQAVRELPLERETTHTNRGRGRDTAIAVTSTR